MFPGPARNIEDECDYDKYSALMKESVGAAVQIPSKHLSSADCRLRDQQQKIKANYMGFCCILGM